jgi:hypothetical protein
MNVNPFVTINGICKVLFAEKFLSIAHRSGELYDYAELNAADNIYFRPEPQGSLVFVAYASGSFGIFVFLAF